MVKFQVCQMPIISDLGGVLTPSSHLDLPGLQCQLGKCSKLKAPMGLTNLNLDKLGLRRHFADTCIVVETTRSVDLKPKNCRRSKKT